ncbi:MAG: hypothetical protein WC136_01355 [Sphaerochaeta sp.]|jgi:hypothetical protein
MKTKTSIIDNLTNSEISEILKQYEELKNKGFTGDGILRQKAKEYFSDLPESLSLELFAKEVAYQVCIKYWINDVLEK